MLCIYLYNLHLLRVVLASHAVLAPRVDKKDYVAFAKDYAKDHAKDHAKDRGDTHLVCASITVALTAAKLICSLSIVAKSRRTVI